MYILSAAVFFFAFSNRMMILHLVLFNPPDSVMQVCFIMFLFIALLFKVYRGCHIRGRKRNMVMQRQKSDHFYVDVVIGEVFKPRNP